MKKFGKAKKTKVVEWAKTLIIVLLFLSCIFFCSKIFETYREQTMGDGLWGQKNTINLSQTLTNTTKEEILNDFVKLSEPVEIIVSRGNGRAIIPYGSDEFNILSSSSAKLVRAGFVLTADEFLIAEADEWENALKNDSVYVKYPESRSVWFEAEIYQSVGGICDVLKSYDELLLMAGYGDFTTVFFRDRQEEIIIKARIDSTETNTIMDVLKKYDSTQEKDCKFAWELNLDENNSGNAVLESMMVLPENETTARDIVTNITRVYKLGLNFTKSTEFVSGLINIFGYNPNTVRQYVSNDDSLIFVGETGSLSVHPEGKIEYKALDANEGVLLAPDGQLRPTTILSGLSSIIERIFDVSGIDKESRNFDIKFTKMPKNIEGASKFELCFDYFVDGKKLIFSDIPAIYAALENGVLVELKIEVRDIQGLENKSQLDSIFTAIDNFNMENPKIHSRIDVQSVYRCTENGEKIKATWQILSVR